MTDIGDTRRCIGTGYKTKTKSEEWAWGRHKRGQKQRLNNEHGVLYCRTWKWRGHVMNTNKNKHVFDYLLIICHSHSDRNT
jgi:hypothetical protein